MPFDRPGWTQATHSRYSLFSSLLTAIFILFALAVVVGCAGGDSEEQSNGASIGSAQDPGPVHVHGLGMDPADETLYIASHTGLFRLPKNSSNATRVADRYQDTMAFTVTGPGSFLGSGHPDMREDLPPFLGLIESTDAGESWVEVSLQGEVDFHLLAASGPRVYGFGSVWESNESVFLTSNDGGKSWTKREAPDSLIGLAVSPRKPRTLIASSARSLFLTKDGGETWNRTPGSPGLLAWPQPDRLYLADPKGSIERSTNMGQSWRQAGRLPGPPSALGSGPGELFAATHNGAVLESRDQGATWSERFSP
jgi:photosystem II stability/assembly factor-like uncharacterized protein